MGFDLHPGDEILTTNLDYPRVIMDIQQRERRDGVKMVQAQLPAVTRNLSDLIRPIEDAISPKTKLISIFQVSFLNGQILPVREVVELGRKHQIPVIVGGVDGIIRWSESSLAFFVTRMLDRSVTLPEGEFVDLDRIFGSAGCPDGTLSPSES